MQNVRLAGLAAVIALGIAGGAQPAYAQKPALEAGEKESESTGLAMFLTKTDSMVAGHALHYAARMLEEGRDVLIILVGDAGQLAAKGAATSASSFSGNALQAELTDFIAEGGVVAITPPTIAALGGDYEALIDGVGPPEDPRAVHDFMYEPRTRLIVF